MSDFFGIVLYFVDIILKDGYYFLHFGKFKHPSFSYIQGTSWLYRQTAALRPQMRQYPHGQWGGSSVGDFCEFFARIADKRS